MKTIYKILNIGALGILFFLSACSYEDPITSKVTNYPILTVNGETTMVLIEGDTYTEEGAEATEAGVEIEVTTTGSESVDTSTPGVYNVYYSAVNVDGFPAEARRIIIVLSSAPSAINLEGTFFRNGNPNNVTRLGDRVYECDNAGGLAIASPADEDLLIHATFYNIDDEHVYIPYQEDTSVSGIDVESNIGTIIDENNFNWVLTASATYGTAVRNFSR
jgi:hypothetical protein